MSIQDQVIAILAEQAVLEPSDVTMASTLEDLGIDSMGVVESIFAIEEAFDLWQGSHEQIDDVLMIGIKL